jgi:hypothetical protein
MTSCKDMLLQDSDRYDYTSANDTAYSYWGILKCLQKVAERQVILGEIRGDLERGTSYVSDTINDIANFNTTKDGDCDLLSIKDYYAIINNCNTYLANCDTTKVKATKKYMVPEYKQVMIIRAWTYLQLVQNYGEVPYITQPITTLDVVKNFNGDIINKDNIVDKLINQSGLLQFSDIVNAEYPGLGSYDTGKPSIYAKWCYFSPDIVMGDIYLLANQYDNAAQSYYNYFNRNTYNATLPYSYCTAIQNNSGKASYSASSYLKMFSSYSTNSTGDEMMTVIPGAANARFGHMLTEHVNLMGWATTSYITTTTTTDADGKSTTNDAGSISTGISYPTQQITPSQGFYTLSGKQTYERYNQENGYITYIDGGDARKNGAYSESRSGSLIYSYTPQGTNDTYNFINKYTSDGISYMIPVYRKAQVYLNFAEAMNRAGHPEFAFAILKDGLCYNNLPKYEQKDVIFTIYDADSTIIGKDTAQAWVWIAPEATSGGAYYIDANAMRNAQGVGYLNFSANRWDANNSGIHARGCGETSGKRDTMYTYARVLAAYKAAGHSLSTKADTIDAIEDCIVDEMALELSFEGYRFPELLRVSYHKTQAGSDGAAWLADKIARRNDDGSANYSSTAAYQTLYQKLMNKSNWYLPKPASYK